MGRGRCLARMIAMYGAPWFGAMALLLLAGIIAGFVFDFRFLILGLMILFILMPMLAAYIYFYYGLRRECWLNVVDHSIGIGDDGLDVKIYDTDGEQVELRTSFMIPYKDLSGYKVGKDCVYFMIARPVKGFVWFPVEGKDMEESGVSTQQRVEMVKEIGKRIRSTK